MAHNPDRPATSPLLAHRRPPAPRLPELRGRQRAAVRPHTGWNRPRPGFSGRSRHGPATPRALRCMAGADPLHLPVRLPARRGTTLDTADIPRGECEASGRPPGTGLPEDHPAPGPFLNCSRLASGVPLHGQRLRRSPPDAVRNPHTDRVQDQVVRSGPVVHPCSGAPRPGPRGCGRRTNRRTTRQPDPRGRQPTCTPDPPRPVVDSGTCDLLSCSRPGALLTGAVAGRLGPLGVDPPATRWRRPPPRP